MAVFSSLEIKNVAGRVATAATTIAAQANNAGDNANTIGEICARSGDATGSQLGADWQAVSSHFKNFGQVVETHGNTVRQRLDKYATETMDNEKQSAQEVQQASQEISSLSSYFEV